jgi:outer membrane protein
MGKWCLSEDYYSIIEEVSMFIVLIILIGMSPVDTVHFTLDEAVDYAVVHNPDVEQLTLELQKSEAQVGEALSAFYPQITASGSYVYLGNVPVLEFEGMQLPFGQAENYSASISLQQVLFSWGKIYNAYKMSDFGKKIAELTLTRKKQDIRYAVTDAFYSILVLHETVSLLKESMIQLERHAEAVETRYKAGLVSRFDLLRAQVQVANLKPQVIETENGLRLAEEGFKMLLGMPLTTQFTISGELEMTDESFDLDTLTTVALEQRIELKSLKYTETIAKLNQAIARRTNLPTIVGGASYNYTKPFGTFENEWGSSLTFNIGFEWPLFTGFNTLAQSKKASVELKEARLALENLGKAVRLEVKQAYLRYAAAREAAVAAKDNVSQAEKAFEIMETRYKNGLATNLEYLDAQLALMQAKTNYLSALKNHHTSKAEIYKAIGKEE